MQREFQIVVVSYPHQMDLIYRSWIKGLNETLIKNLISTANRNWICQVEALGIFIIYSILDADLTFKVFLANMNGGEQRLNVDECSLAIIWGHLSYEMVIN